MMASKLARAFASSANCSLTGCGSLPWLSSHRAMPIRLEWPRTVTRPLYSGFHRSP